MAETECGRDSESLLEHESVWFKIIFHMLKEREMRSHLSPL